MMKLATVGTKARVPMVSDINIPENSLMNEFIKIPGVDLQAIGNASMFLEQLFVLPIKASLEFVEDDLKLFLQVQAPVEQFSTARAKVEDALYSLERFHAPLAPHIVLTVRIAAA